MKTGRKNSLSAMCLHIYYGGKGSDIYDASYITQVSWIPPMKAVLECRLKSNTKAQCWGYPQGIFKIQSRQICPKTGRAEQSTTVKEEASPKHET